MYIHLGTPGGLAVLGILYSLGVVKWCGLRNHFWIPMVHGHVLAADSGAGRH